MNTLPVVFLGLLLTSTQLPTAAAPAAGLPLKLESALLDCDWEAVVASLASSPDSIPAPVLRAIEGHAFLALNRSQEASQNLRVLTDPDSITTWADWTAAFAERRPESPVSAYLRGDALSRRGNWSKASAEYSRALDLAKTPAHPIRPLALNSRGVANAFLGKHAEAKRDFDAAIAAQPDFADPYINCGILLIIMEAGEGAVLYLNKAVAVAPDSAPARNARGCALLGASREERSITKAMEDFLFAAKALETRDLALANIAALKRSFVGEDNDQQSSAPGTTMTSRELFDVLTSQGPGKAQQYLQKQPAAHQVKLQREFAWNKKWSGASEMLSFDLNVGALKIHGAGYKGDRDKWASLEAMSKQAHYSQPGGGDTQSTALENSSGDVGPWPAKETRFTLHCGRELPSNP